MCVHIVLGEALRREVGAAGTDVTLTPHEADEGIEVGALAERAGVRLRDEEGSLLVIVNGRAYPEAAEQGLLVHDGDRVDFELMLSGG